MDQLTVPASGTGDTVAVNVTELPVLGEEGDAVSPVVVGAATYRFAVPVDDAKLLWPAELVWGVKVTAIE